MMFVLVLMLFAQIIFFYLLFDRNILSPTVIGTAMFFVSSLIALLYAPKWRTGISLHTTLVIVSSLFVMGMGEFLVHLVNYRRRQCAKIDLSKEKPIHVKPFAVYALVLFFMLLLVYYYKDTIRLAKAAGYKSGNGVLMLYYARQAVVNESGSYPTRTKLAAMTFNLVKNTACAFSYFFLYNKIICKKTRCLYQLLPVLIYIPFVILTTGRTEFIYLVAVWIVVGSVFFMQTKNWNPRYTGKIIRVGVTGICIFLAFFVFAGSFKSASIAEHAFDTIAFYAGLSIPSLDYYFAHSYPPNVIFGEHTLFGMYRILRKFNHSIPYLYAPYEMTYFHNVRGNVYTAIRRYHQDFGYAGLYFMMFFLGFLYSYMYLRVNKTRRSMWLLFYAISLPPIVEISIEERFFMSIMYTSTLYTFLYQYALFKIFVTRTGYFKKVVFTSAEPRGMYEG